MPVARIWPIVAWLAATLAASLVLLFALRRRHVPIPPACRRCGYDVSRRPSGVERCSECGAMLSDPRAIVTRRRGRKRWWIVAPAMLAAVACAVVLGLRTKNFPWLDYYLARAPVGWLASHARARTGIDGNAYRAAWKRRDDSPALVDHLLDLQAGGHLATNAVWERDLYMRMWTSKAVRERAVVMALQEGLRADRSATSGPTPATTTSPAGRRRPPTISNAQYERFVSALFREPVTFTLLAPPRVGQELRVRVTPSSAAKPLSNGWEVRSTLALNFGAPAVVVPGQFGDRGLLRSVIEKRAMPWRHVGGPATPGRYVLHWTLERGDDDFYHVALDARGGDASLPPPTRFQISGTLEVDVLPARATAPSTTTSPRVP